MAAAAERDADRQAWADYEWHISDRNGNRAELRRSSEKLFNKWPRQKRRNISAAGTAAIRARNLYAQAWRQVQFQGNTNHPVPATNDAAFRLQQELLRVALDYVEALDAIVRLQNSGHMHRRASRTWAVRRADGVSHLAINVGKAVDRYRNALRLPEARPEGVGWFGGWDPIGKGGFGAARVFVRQNAEAEIVNRVVMKDSHFGNSEQGRELWRHPRFWASHKGALMPLEVKSLSDLRGRHGSEYVIKILNWAMDEQRMFHRIYMESAPYSDLNALKTKFAEASETFPPEPLIWHLFECLAKAALLLEQGELSPNPMSDWTLILHRDLKLSNVFLGLSDPKNYSGYPTPKIGDFGLALYVTDDGQRNPGSYPFNGTPGNMPPEMLESNIDARHGVPLSSKTNVWGIGNIIGSMMWWPTEVKLYEGLRGLTYEHGAAEPSFDDHEQEAYSKPLRDLVLWCMKYDQDGRPTSAELLRRIRALRDSHNAGLREADAGDQAWERDENSMLGHLRDEDWQIRGLVRDAMPLPDGQAFPDAPERGEVEQDADEVLAIPALSA